MPAAADAFDLRQQHFEVFVIMYRVNDSCIHYQQRCRRVIVEETRVALGKALQVKPAYAPLCIDTEA